MLSSVCVGVVVSVVLGGAPNLNPWEKIDQENGVSVWTREVPGSGFREMKAEAVVRAPAATIWGVIADVTNYREFMPYTHSVRVLSRTADGFVNYVITDPPLISRRDYAAKHTVVIDKAAGLYQRYYQEANELAPPLGDGVVRMKLIRGYWSVEAIDDGAARVQYVVHTDPGGLVPGWLVNANSMSTMGEVFRCLRNRLRDPSWKRG